MFTAAMTPANAPPWTIEFKPKENSQDPIGVASAVQFNAHLRPAVPSREYLHASKSDMRVEKVEHYE